MLTRPLLDAGARDAWKQLALRAPLAALSWKGLRAEAAVSDKVIMSAELRLQNFSIQRRLVMAEPPAMHSAPAGIVTSHPE